MSRWYVKMYPSVLHDARWAELSFEARGVWCILVMVAGDVDLDGRLEVKGVRPMVARDFVARTGLSEKRLENVIEELLRVPSFLRRDLTGTLVIEKWDEKQAKNAQNRARVQRWRTKDRNAKVTENALPTVTETALPPSADGNAKVTPCYSNSKSNSLSIDNGDGGSPTPPWQETVKEDARRLQRKTILSLDAEQRSTLARYHCLEFGNCTKSESRNKKMSTMVAAKLATLGRRKFFEGLTVGKYVAYARKLHEQRERAPWFDPHLIEAVVELEGGSK